MNKDTIIGFVLIALVLIGFSWWNQPSAEQIEAARLQDSIAAVQQEKAKQAQQAAAKAAAAAKVTDSIPSDTTTLFHAAKSGTSQQVVLKNAKLELTLDTKGGVVRKAVIKDFKSIDGSENVTLFDAEDQNLNFMLAGKQDNIVTQDLYFTPSEQTDSTVTMTATAQNGGEVIMRYRLGQNYLLSLSFQTRGLAGLFPPSMKELEMEWTDHCRQQEKGYSFENRYSTITYRDTNGSTDELSASGSDEEEDASDFDSKLQWVAFKTQFFSQILIADGNFSVDRMESKQIPEVKEEGETKYLKTYTAELNSTFDPAGKNPTNLKLYIGPNRFSTLKENEALIVKGQSVKGQELDLQSIVYLGWPVIRWINRFVFLYLFDWMTGWGLNMGLVLLIITLIVKFAVFPLMRKSYLSSANMRVLRPKIDEINAKYPNKEDAMLKQQEVMQLYSQYGVSPMGGCLPMVIQMPIWIALFNFIPNYIEMRGESFLWADDLSTYDDIINWGVNVWGIGDHLSLFCILWCVSTVINSIISQRQQQYAMTPEQQQQMGMMKWMTYLMPVIFFFSFNSYSAGLNWYYFISGLVSILMMWFLRKTTDDDELLRKLEKRHAERKANAGDKKKTSSIMERLQAMQEKQLEILKQQQENRK